MQVLLRFGGILYIVNVILILEHPIGSYNVSLQNRLISFMKNLYLLLLTFLPLAAHAQTITRLDGSNITAAALDQQIQQLMQAAQVQGLAVTVFNQNQPVYKKAFGYKNVETKEPLKTSTNLYGA
jgi:CubicO group peptidase (beta-lactamase class C family)